MDTVINAFDYVLDYLNSVPPKSWLALGVLLASVPAVIAIVEWVKRHHFKVRAEELGKGFVALNLVFWSTVMTVADFIVTNGSNFGPFLPFLGTHLAQIIAGATTVYTLSKSIRGWFKNKQAQEAFTNPNHLDTLVAMANERAQQSSSFGTEASGKQPGQNIIQL